MPTFGLKEKRTIFTKKNRQFCVIQLKMKTQICFFFYHIFHKIANSEQDMVQSGRESVIIHSSHAEQRHDVFKALCRLSWLTPFIQLGFFSSHSPDASKTTLPNVRNIISTPLTPLSSKKSKRRADPVNQTWQISLWSLQCAAIKGSSLMVTQIRAI